MVYEVYEFLWVIGVEVDYEFLIVNVIGVVGVDVYVFEWFGGVDVFVYYFLVGVGG